MRYMLEFFLEKIISGVISSMNYQLNSFVFIWKGYYIKNMSNQRTNIVS